MGGNGSRNHFIADCMCYSTEALKKYFSFIKDNKIEHMKIEKKKKARNLLGESMQDDLQKASGNTHSHEEGKELQKSQVIQLGRPMARISVFDEDTAGTNQRRLVQHVEIRLLGLHVSEYSRDVRNSQRRGFNLKTGEGVKMAE